MKKVLLVAGIVAALAAPVKAHDVCNGECLCGGQKPPTSLEKAIDAATSLGKWGAYLAAGLYAAAHGGPGWILGVPELCIYMSRHQRAYNRAHGITHSREKRRAWRAAR